MAGPAHPAQSAACERCGRPLPPGGGVCQACCAAAGGPVEDEAYVLLAAANLARMRGEWQEGIDRCAEALEADPENPTAYSLLGDIYFDQGRREEAIRWYEMAVDLDPENAADQAKLERVRTPLVMEATPPPFWVRIFVIAGAFVSFSMIAIGVWALLNSGTPEAAILRAAGEPPAMGAQLPPSLRPPQPRLRGAGIAAAGERGRPAPIETVREGQLHAMLQNRLGSTVPVLGVEIDPSVQEAVISLAFSPRAAADRNGIIPILFASSLWTYRGDEGLMECRIRALDTPSAVVGPTVLLAVARSKRETVEKVPPSGSTAQQQAALDLWWGASGPQAARPVPAPQTVSGHSDPGSLTSIPKTPRVDARSTEPPGPASTPNDPAAGH